MIIYISPPPVLVQKVAVVGPSDSAAHWTNSFVEAQIGSLRAHRPMIMREILYIGEGMFASNH